MIHENKLTSQKRYRGLVLVDKILKPLSAAQEAYNNRLVAPKDLPNQRKEYPNPREERENLEDQINTNEEQTSPKTSKQESK